MSDLAIADPSAPLAPGQMRLYCAAEPPLQAGGYWLQALQTVDGLKAQPANNSFGVQNPFVVTGPRFRLPPQDLQCVYPPANMVGNYNESLCHVVLRTRTLPWVRSIDGSTAGGGDDAGTVPPWVALLTLYPDEMKGVVPTTVSVAQLLKPGDATILPPALADADQLTTEELASQMLAIDIDLATFRNIAPKLSELPMLAHVREVNTDQKEIMGMVDDGWFSVVVGNRLPLAGAGNNCFLVSLEGHQGNLLDGGTIPAQYSKIRLVSLASWSFTANPSRGSFLGYMHELGNRGGVQLLRPFNTKLPPATDAAGKAARQALEIGYLPLTNITRSGESTTSWYRGPLSPVPTAPDQLGPYFYSDRAIRYDQSNGIFNMAFASAWQIGQLLGLSDAAFASALFKWRVNTYQAVAGSVSSAHLQQFVDEWNLQGRASADASMVAPALLHLFGQATSSAAAPAPIAAHHLRDTPSLSGVLPDLNQQIEAGADPLYLLRQHLQQAATT